jgi:hypothetical protein
VVVVVVDPPSHPPTHIYIYILEWTRQFTLAGEKWN